MVLGILYLIPKKMSSIIYLGSELRNWCMSRLMSASVCLSTNTVARLYFWASFFIPSKCCASLAAYDLSASVYARSLTRLASSDSTSPWVWGSNCSNGRIVRAVLILVTSSSSKISLRSSSANLSSRKLLKKFWVSKKYSASLFPTASNRTSALKKTISSYFHDASWSDGIFPSLYSCWF